MEEFKDLAEEKISIGLITYKLFFCAQAKNFKPLEELYDNWPFHKNLFQYWFAKSFMNGNDILKSYLVNNSLFEFLVKIGAGETVTKYFKVYNGDSK